MPQGKPSKLRDPRPSINGLRGSYERYMRFLVVHGLVYEFICSYRIGKILLDSFRKWGRVYDRDVYRMGLFTVCFHLMGDGRYMVRVYVRNGLGKHGLQSFLKYVGRALSLEDFQEFVYGVREVSCPHIAIDADYILGGVEKDGDVVERIAEALRLKGLSKYFIVTIDATPFQKTIEIKPTKHFLELVSRENFVEALAEELNEIVRSLRRILEKTGETVDKSLKKDFEKLCERFNIILDTLGLGSEI